MTREDLKALSKNDLIREVLRLRGILEQQMSAAPGIGDEIVVEGIVSVTTRQPLVSMRTGEAAWQLTPTHARQHALATLERAIEAERDAAVFVGITEAFDEDTAVGLINMIRSTRPQVVHRVVEEPVE